MDKPKVIGLDLSLTSTGIALTNGTTIVIKGAASLGDWRLCRIRDAVAHAIDTDRPDLVVIEDLPTHAKSAGLTGMVHGAVRALLVDREIPYALISPATLKAYATGKGNADKAGMLWSAYRWGSKEFANDRGGDQCDAWWLRAAGLQWLGHPEFDLPAAQVARLDKAQWPQMEVAR
ncbi:crossover junction endodeoxyribonuclease RuvC [Nocardiopsis sp. NPDC007018]|uniref:crossover junction endodeoxyribonuclease RuvC n=1 Tax=Nocardiopsis sp. NPDC007018 TaxID=3155721 RepID=UPI0033F066C4